jgi:serine-type D-Ala-D-Ala carboxypeptidase/endopeptidase (penicillin-binding protein 4)
VEDGQSLFSLNSGKLMMPASNMKVLTVATAAEVLGWDARMTTTLEATAPVEGGILRGDLFVRGGGDPTINTREGRGEAVFSAWADTLKAAGITSIAGRIVGDDQAFDDEGIGGGWAWDYLQYGYAAPVGALQYNEDVAALIVTPSALAGEPPTVRLSAGSGLTLVNRALTGPEGTPESIDYRRHLDSPVLEVTGAIPAAGKPATRSVAVVNPTRFFVQSLKDAFVARGIAVSGDAVDLDDIAGELDPRAERRVLASAESPPLREVAAVLMKVSQNLYAETLLKAAGRARGGLGTTAAGREAVRATLTSWGVPEDAYVMADGSGLSRYNYVSAAALTTILERMYKEPKHRDAFVATLAVAGKDGTVSTRLRRTRAEGNAVVKTGSIANVRSLSGFVRSRDGEMIVFSILANDFVIPAATVNWIADLAVEVLSNFTRRNAASREPGRTK